MDIKNIRKERLRALVSEFGSASKVAQMSETSANYISQIISPRGKRNLGYALARKIESGCNKPEGWMDLPIESEGQNLTPKEKLLENESFRELYAEIPQLECKLKVSERGRELDPGNIMLETHTCPRSWLRENGWDESKVVFKRCLDTHLSPIIRKDSVILINTADQEIEDGFIYAINYSGTAKIRRAVYRFDGYLKLAGGGQMPEFAEEVLTPEEQKKLKVIGRIVWTGGNL